MWTFSLGHWSAKVRVTSLYVFCFCCSLNPFFMLVPVEVGLYTNLPNSAMDRRPPSCGFGSIPNEILLSIRLAVLGLEMVTILSVWSWLWQSATPTSIRYFYNPCVLAMPNLTTDNQIWGSYFSTNPVQPQRRQFEPNPSEDSFEITTPKSWCVQKTRLRLLEFNFIHWLRFEELNSCKAACLRSQLTMLIILHYVTHLHQATKTESFAQAHQSSIWFNQ